MKSIVFNIDCLLNFLKVKRSDLLEKEYKKIIISNKVYNTLSNPSIPYFIREELDELISKKFIKIVEISINTEVYDLYYKIVKNQDNEILGESEASSIALAVQMNKTLAYNNPRLIEDYMTEFSIDCITTSNILDNLLEDGFLSEDELYAILEELNKY